MPEGFVNPINPSTIHPFNESIPVGLVNPTYATNVFKTLSRPIGHPLPEGEGNRERFTPHPSRFTYKKAAFTLAEVLITLGIIGIVAAMTLPALVGKYQEKVWVTRFQQSYSILSQAYMSASREYGYSKDWGVSNVNSSETNKASAILIGEILSKYMKVTRADNKLFYSVYDLHGNLQTGLLRNDNVPVYALANGTTLKFSRPVGLEEDGVVLEYQASVLLDVNGAQKPNTFGKDIFMLYFSADKPIVTGYELPWVNELSCSTKQKQRWYAGGACATWVIKKGNMDYLHRELTHYEWIK